MLRWSLLSIVLIVVALCTSGCGNSGPLVPVEGVVKINGQPAGNLQVIFTQAQALPGKQRKAGSAISDAGGKFVLKPNDGSPGLPPGKYKVAVLDNNLAVDEEPDPNKPPIPNRIPRMYADVLSTPLDVEVVEGKSDYEINVPIF
jgi:hypothetical protein